MEKNNLFLKNLTTEPTDIVIPKTFITNVFAYMCGALAISALIAYYFAFSQNLMNYLINFETGKTTALGYIVIFAPFAFVMLMSFSFNKLSSFALLLIFLLYSSIMGISMSFIFLAYTTASIFKTFAITSATFGTMALVGYTTKTDLSKFGSILFMALIGIIIASVVNFFLESGSLDFIISILGVLIFTGLTAYDVQKLKKIASQLGTSIEVSNKFAIMGALTLYLDFINLFLFLLRFLGNRRN